MDNYVCKINTMIDLKSTKQISLRDCEFVFTVQQNLPKNVAPTPKNVLNISIRKFVMIQVITKAINS